MRMSVTTTSAPARASARQSALPRPRDPPVTTATLPVRSNMQAPRGIDECGRSESLALGLQNGLMTVPWRRPDRPVSGPTLDNVLPPNAVPDPEPPPVTAELRQVELFPPPPPNPVHGRSPALAIGLVCALMVATAAGSLGLARAIATGFPTHFGSGPATFPAPSPPDEATPLGKVPSAATLLTALTATPATPDVTIDPALAQRIVDTMWPVREAALASNDPENLASFETGSALQGDSAEIAAYACGCTLQPRPLAVRNLF